MLLEKLTYSTIFQLAAEGLTEFSTHIVTQHNAPHVQKALNFYRPPAEALANLEGSSQDSLELPFCVNATECIKVFSSKRHDSSLPAASHQLLSFVPTPVLLRVLLHVRISWTEPSQIPECRPRFPLGPRSLWVVPTQLWKHQYISAISTQQ